MSIPLAVYCALSTFFLKATTALPMLEQTRLACTHLIQAIIQAQLPFNFLIVIGVVSLWRGAWGLMDLHIFPKNMSLSYIVSLGIGLIIIASTYDFAKNYI